MFFLIFSCEKDDYFEETKTEVVENNINKTLNFITLKEFYKNFPENKKLQNLIRFFDEERLKESYSINTTSVPYLDTSNIAQVSKDGYAIYTFRVLNFSNDLTNFHNLVVTIDNIGNIISMRLLEYTPSASSNNTNNFVGTVKLLENNVFSAGDIFYTENSIESNSVPCVVDVLESRACLEYIKVPNPPGIECTEYTTVYTLIYGSCSVGPGDGTPIGSGIGSSGASGGSGGSGGGSGVGTGNDNNNCVPAIDNPCPEDDTVITFPLPPVDDDKENPCDKIAEQIEDEDFQQAVSDYLGDYSDTQESGFSEDIAGNFAALPLDANGHTLNFNPSIYLTGLTHIHLNPFNVLLSNGDILQNKPILMPSPQDIKDLLLLVSMTHQSNQTFNTIEDLYINTFTSQGKYTIKFSGDPSVINLNNFDLESLNEIYISKFKEFKDLEKAFLKFLNDNINVNGIDLYKIEDDNTITKKELNKFNQVISNPC